MFDQNILSENIKHYRKMKNLSQTELAEKLSVSPQSVSKWECGIALPSLEKIYSISKILNISVDRLLSADEDEPCMIGVDGGGTKTEFVLFKKDGKVINRLLRPGCNPNTCGIEQTVSILKDGIDTLLTGNTSLGGVFIGAAGFGSGENKALITQALKRSCRQIKIKCDTDIINVIYGATEEENCVAAICGTGMVVYVKNGDELTRIGGWGYLLDKAGSGYTIGCEALRTALAERDGIGEKSLITVLAEKKLGKTPWDSISDIYKGGNSFIASFSPLVSEAYTMGDKKAREILESNASQFAEYVNFAAKNLCHGKTVVISGSMVTKNKVYSKLIAERISPECKLIIPELPSVYGACIQCCKLCDVPTGPLKENFGRSYYSIKNT